jgi:PAS domain S-box-containing protein
VDDQGKIDRWYVTAFDIEDRKGAEEALRKSERQFRLLVETIPALVWRSTPEGDLDYLNRRAVEYLGHTAESLAGGRWLELVHPDHRDATLQRWMQSASSGTAYEDEYQLRQADGQYRWIQSVGEPFLDTEGRIANWYGVVFDIDDRKRAEDAQVRQAGVRADVSAAFSKPTHLGEILRGCTEAIVRHLDAAFARIWMLNNDESMLELQASAGMYTRLDGSYSRISVGDLKVGLIAREKKAHFTNDVMNDPRVSDKGWAQSNGMVAFAGYPLVVEDRLIGVVALFARHTLPESILDTLASVADTIAQGIERKRAEESLRSALDEVQKSEAKLRQITNAIPILIQVLRSDGSVLYANQPVLDYTGLTLGEVQREDYRARVFHPEDVERLREERREALTRPVPFENEQRVLGKDGRYRWFLIRYNPLLDEQGRIDRWYVVGLDIEDRKLAESQVEQAYIRLAEAQELSKTGSFITDLLADDHDWSEEAFRIFEFDPATKVTVQMVRDTIHPDDLSSFDAMIARAMAGTDVDFVFRIVTSRRALKHVRGMARVMEQIGGRPLFIGALQDITESKAAEEALSRARAELAHMARVTTLSTLTASISHEVNQPIAAAVTSAGACLRWLNRDQPDIKKARDAATRIEQDARRAAEIISNLKGFYKKDVSPLRELISVNELIDEMLVLLRSEADRHSVVMRTELAVDLPSVSADRVQLQQVLMNLMLNGMEAMSERGGELNVGTRREGDEVIVSVSDTGVGIPAGKREEIFKAFVTTKAGGTGMGLAISSTIIESHGGRLWATANPAPGATFHFTIPTQLEATSEL